MHQVLGATQIVQLKRRGSAKLSRARAEAILCDAMQGGHAAVDRWDSNSKPAIRNIQPQQTLGVPCQRSHEPTRTSYSECIADSGSLLAHLRQPFHHQPPTTRACVATYLQCIADSGSLLAHLWQHPLKRAAHLKNLEVHIHEEICGGRRGEEQAGVGAKLGVGNRERQMHA